MFREPEQLNEECRVQEAAQLNTRPDNEGSPIAYWKYIQNRQRIVTIEEQLQIHDLLWFVVLPANFWEPQTGVFEALEELKIDGQRANVLHLATLWAATEI